MVLGMGFGTYLAQTLANTNLGNNELCAPSATWYKNKILKLTLANTDLGNNELCT
jgi:hypothetical protein